MRVVVAGLGKAGSLLAKRIAASSDMELVGAVCRDTSPSSGKTVGDVLNATGMDYPIVPVSHAAGLMQAADALVDFSNEDFTPRLVELCGSSSTNVVICTTNHTETQLRSFQEAAQNEDIGIVYAPTLTLGINLVIEFAKKISCVLPHFDFAIVERHRRDKPPVSETARKIAEATNADPPISSLRVGGYVGVHELACVGDNECISIVHESFSREAFVDGAIAATEFIQGKKGYFTMEDVMSELEAKCLNLEGCGNG